MHFLDLVEKLGNSMEIVEVPYIKNLGVLLKFKNNPKQQIYIDSDYLRHFRDCPEYMKCIFFRNYLIETKS